MSDHQQKQYEDYMARRDQYEYEKLEDNFKSLQEENQMLKAQLEKAESFLSSIKGWGMPTGFKLKITKEYFNQKDVR